jgi:hypothetical protein
MLLIRTNSDSVNLSNNSNTGRCETALAGGQQFRLVRDRLNARHIARKNKIGETIFEND